MSTPGPTQTHAPDDDGGRYTLKTELGRGVEARTFKATIDHAPKSNKAMHPGDPVAVKVLQPPNPVATDFAEKVESRKREQQVLEREGTLLAKKLPKPKDEDRQSYMVVPIFPGTTLQKAMYEVSKDTGIGNKKDIVSGTKENYAIGLLLDLASIHLCGIVHCDLKTDNVLVDPDSQTAKIIDMGEGFIAAEGSFSEKFRGPGAIFEAPETHEPGGFKTHLNSFKTDLYALGTILASMYTAKNYERDVTTPGANRAIGARNFMDDITGPAATHKEGMPDALLSVVRSLMTVDPAARPASIALAAGVDQHPQLQAIVQAHRELTQFKNTELKADVAKISDDRHVSTEFKDKLNNIFTTQADLPTMRVKLAELCKEHPEEKAGIKAVTAMGEKIDKACIQQARIIQAIRPAAIAEHKVKEGLLMYAGNVRGLAEMLDAKAKQHKNDGTAMVFGSMAPVTATQLDDIGKRLLITSKTLTSLPKPLNPVDVDKALTGLREAVEAMPKEKFGAAGEDAKKNLVSFLDRMQEKHDTAKEQLPKVEPERRSPSPSRH